MGVFVNYLSNMFEEVTSIPQTILTTDEHVLLINSITVCNLGAEKIRFNLKKQRNTDSGLTEIFVVNQFEMNPYETVELIYKLGLQIVLQYKLLPSIVSDSLICFTNGYTQKADCEISYTQLNELP